MSPRGRSGGAAPGIQRLTSSDGSVGLTPSTGKGPSVDLAGAAPVKLPSGQFHVSFWSAAGTTEATWTEIDATKRITLPAKDGDTILAGVAWRWDAQATWMRGSIATVVAGVLTNNFDGTGAVVGSNSNGLSGIGVHTNESWYTDGAGTYPYVVQAGDLAAGDITLTMIFRQTAGGQAARGFVDGLAFWAVNLGQ